ncbi:hypothetical protein [Mesorhizobium sp. KR1-2]|uniref:hypothetical protein n=1 Tax=Mesorhizobium sp. KR1-2 TaxID=3156609 RepID=UPI0032B48184
MRADKQTSDRAAPLRSRPFSPQAVFGNVTVAARLRSAALPAGVRAYASRHLLFVKFMNEEYLCSAVYQKHVFVISMAKQLIAIGKIGERNAEEAMKAPYSEGSTGKRQRTTRTGMAE